MNMNCAYATQLLDHVALSLQHGVHTIDILRQKGYESNFRLSGNGLYCIENGITYKHLQFEVDEISYVENAFSEKDGYSVFALSHRIENLKGLFVAIGFTGSKGVYERLNKNQQSE